MPIKAGTGVVVTGFADIDRRLKKLETKVQNKVAKSSMRKATKEIILPEAKNRVPVDSGQLEDSIVVRAMRSKNRIGAVVMTRDGYYKGDEFYGSFIELGTKTMKADPFLRPAGYGNEHKVRKLVEKDIVDTLARMAVK